MARASDIFLKRDRACNATAWMPVRLGVSFRILSAMNDAYQSDINAQGHEGEDEYFAKKVAQHLLLDWKGLDDDEGNPLPCTLENKIKLLTEYTEIGSLIVSFATTPSRFVEANFIDSELGN